MQAGSKRKAIVVVSFGSTYLRAIDTCIVPIEHAIANEFGSYKVYRAFTSTFVRDRLGAQGVTVEGLAELLERLLQEGYEEIVIQPTHIIDGAEYRRKVLDVARVYQARLARLRIGMPLLACDASLHSLSEQEEIARAIAGQFPALADDEAVVLMGHGSRCAGSSVYASLQTAFEQLGMAVVIGVMEEEDSMSLEYVLERLSEMKRVRSIYLAPLLLVAGCHTQKDMTGGEASWQASLTRAGYKVKTHLVGLGENPAIRALYVKRICNLIEK